MAFDGSGSSNAVNWDWAINGTSTPYPTGVNPSVIMNTAGTHWVYLAAYNYCGFWHVDSAQVTVDPTPNVAVTASTTVICPTGSANLTASGATSYVWSPTTGLSCSTCPNPVATPASTTTYTVTGTTGGCSNDSYITIDVDNSPPVSMFLQDNDTICEGDAVTYNGAVSTNASTYSWAFTGGDISSSTSSNVTVTYASAGTYTIDLTVENNCTQTDLSSGQIVVLPLTAPGCATGLEDLGSLTGITSFMDAHSDEINIDFLNAVDGQVTIELISATGQLVSSQTIENIANGYRHRMNVESFERAIYMLRVSSVDAQYVSKFVID